LGQELALGLLRGEPGDDLELASLLVEGLGEPTLFLTDPDLALGQRALLVTVGAHPAVDLVQLAGQLLFLGHDPLLALLEVALAPAGFRFQLLAGLEGDLLGLEVSGPAAGVRLALAGDHDLPRALAGVADLPVADPLVDEDTEEEGDDDEDRIEDPERLDHGLSSPRLRGERQIAVRFE